MTQDEAIKILSEFVSSRHEVSDLPSADAILLFGNVGSGPKLAAHIADLHKQGKASTILVSGKSGKTPLPEGYEDEATFLTHKLISHGIDESVIVQENQATNTLENALFGMRTAKEQGLDIKSIILVAAPMSSLRARLTFMKHFPEVSAFSSTVDIPFSEWPLTEPLPRLLGEIDRLPRYAEKGDIMPIELSEEILQAYETLKRFVENK